MFLKIKSGVLKYFMVENDVLREKRRVFWTWALVPFVFVLSLSMTYIFLQDSRDIAISSLEKNTSVIVQNKVKDVEKFINEKFKSLESISENEYVRLYLSDMLKDGITPENFDNFVIETNYLRAYAEKVANISGFRNLQNGDNFERGIEADSKYNDGIAIFSSDAEKIVSIDGSPEFNVDFVESLAFSLNPKRVIDRIYITKTSVPVLNFAVPVYDVDSEIVASNIVAWVVGCFEIDNRFFNMVKNENDVYKTAKQYIVREELDESIRYISSVENSFYDESFSHKVSTNVVNRVERFFDDGNGRVFLGKDLFLDDVMGISQKISVGDEWYFVRTISEEEALKPIYDKVKFTVVMFFIVFAALICFFIWVWKFGASIRVLSASKDKDKALQNLSETSEFLKLVTDTQEDDVIVVNKNNEIVFANRKAKRRFKTGFVDSVLHTHSGKLKLKEYSSEMSFGFDFKKAEEIRLLNRDALKSGKIKTSLHKIYNSSVDNLVADVIGHEHSDGSVEHFRTVHIPMKDDMVLVCFHSLTHIIEEKEKEFVEAKAVMSFMSKLISFRTTMSSLKAEYVYSVSQDLALELGLDLQSIERLRLASYLLDCYKLFVSKGVLDKIEKDEKLTKVESDNLKSAHLSVVDMMGHEKFALKVNDVLLQRTENYDGTGLPVGLKGDDICVEARVLRVAEDFVELLIHKNHLLKKDVSEALTHMLMDSEKIYDAKIVSALLNFANNKGGIHKWKKIK